MKTIATRAFVAAAATATLAGGIQIAAAPAANAEGFYGAIAVSSNGSVGRTWDYPTAGSARTAALSFCGWGDCEVLTSFSNGCGAIAETRYSYQGGSGRSLWAAQRSAITLAGGGSIMSWVCTTGHY